jgi:5-methylcytosine-specific restriction protein B
VVGPYEFFEGKTFHQSRPVRWLTVLPAVRPVSEIYEKNFMMSSLYELDKGAIKYDAIEAMIAARDNGRQDYVLIIDEINRANISKVLGELITLLEPDKRDGEINGLTVKLPYSGADFAVPPNVHVIGTMNSADRSIALLDTALRRRFAFEELMPKPEVLANDNTAGVDLRKMLQAMNDRIEALYDRDHAVGHAYLMGVKSLGDLELAFRRRILPLLQEYFHEDWSRIRRVLNENGEGRFLRMSAPVAVPGGEADVLEPEPRPVFRVNPAPFGAEAFRAIYGE